MATYIFETTATMKEYNNRKWWIDSGIIPRVTITADNLAAALSEYQEHAENHYIAISNSALKRKQPMYVDTASGDPKQVGYVITASAYFEASGYKWVKQYIDLWLSIHTVVDTAF